MTSEVSAPRGEPHVALRTAARAAVFTAAVAGPSVLRRWSRKAVQSTPPPLPLISLPPDDEWEEFDVPTKTGFGYSLPHVVLEEEEQVDASAEAPSPLRDRAGICRILSEYMAQNEAVQGKRHRFGIDTKLIYKRSKASGSVPAADMIENELQFDACFESGNLDRAYRVLGRHYATTHELLSSNSTSSTPSWSGAPPFPFFVKVDMEYDLYCDVDVSTHGHIQWYFFRVTPPPSAFAQSSKLRVRFNLRNMLKKSSLYNEGMLPAVHIADTRGWHHTGVNVCYFQNAETYRHRKTGKPTHYYTLSFVYEFTSPATVSFAHSYPYTYSRLQNYLLQLQKDPQRNRFFRRRVLCKTIAGNHCDVLTITDFAHDDDDRSAVVLTARVHPGESNASFLMHGILDFLTGPSMEAHYLRHRYVFKVVPMLNPDGVVHGNYRCSLAGTDLNRRYLSPSPELHPTVHACKSMVLSLAKTRAVSLYCDIHGHSRKKNMFLYGCVPFEDASSRSDAAKLRLFPHVLCKTCSFFSFHDCTFSVAKGKKGTGRVVVWDQAKVLNSFTLEASFFGVGVNKASKRMPVVPSNNQSQGDSVNQAMVHFMPHDLRLAGAKLCLALIPFTQILDRDRPQPPPPMVFSHYRQPERAEEQQQQQPSPSTTPFVSRGPSAHAFTRQPTTLAFQPPASPREVDQSPWTSESKLRLAPLPVSTGVLQPTSPTVPTGEPFFNMDSVFGSLVSADDLLKEIEETLPENYAHGGNDSDDEGDSVGSESDPSGDNMEDEELQRQDSWKNLIPVVESDAVPSSSPKLMRNRSQTLIKRFSDSMLAINMMLEQTQEAALTPSASEPTIATTSRPCEDVVIEQPLRISSALPASKSQVPTLAPIKLRSSPPVQVNHSSRRRPSTTVVHSLQGYQDRNREIASLHLRAVQRRSRAKRGTYQRTAIHDQELP